MHKRWIQGWLLLGVLLVTSLFALPVQAANEPTFEVGETRSLGKEVKVPITIYKTTQLTSLDVRISIPKNQKGVRLKSFEPAGIFAGEQYRFLKDQDQHTMSLDFLSQTTKDPTLSNKPTIVGYITYTLTPEFKEGEAVQLTVEEIHAKGRNGADILYNVLPGKIERKLPVGGVISSEGPSAGAAMRILQHVNGSNPITEEEMRLSADVDGNGIINQDDAQLILDYVTGKISSFFTIGTIELDDAAIGGEYSAQITVKHGRGPYNFRNKGALPAGLKLDRDTGKISGTPRTERNYQFTIVATDGVGNTAERAFEIDVVDSDIVAVDKPSTINVQQGEEPDLPQRLPVTYKDQTRGFEPVRWEDLDTKELGRQFIKGVVGDGQFTIIVEINVVNENYIEKIEITKSPFLDLHIIWLYTTPEVYSITVNGQNMHHDGGDVYNASLANVPSGSNIVFELRDKYGYLLETKSELLLPK